MLRWLPVLLLLAGCSSAPPVQATRTFDAHVEKVWEATRFAIHDEFLDLEHADEEALTLVTERKMLTSGMRAMDVICERPYILVALWSRVRHHLEISLKPHENGTDVTVRATIEGYEMNTTRRWHECESTGRLENDMLKAITKRVRQ